MFIKKSVCVRGFSCLNVAFYKLQHDYDCAHEATNCLLLNYAEQHRLLFVLDKK